MFESDDFDEVLSQFEFSDTIVNKDVNKACPLEVHDNLHQKIFEGKIQQTNTVITADITSVKDKYNNFKEPSSKISTPTKRRIIDKFFDQSSKRKFPGPAGLLNNTIQNEEDTNIDQIELLSQDVSFTENGISKEIFNSSIWKRLKSDIEYNGQNKVDLINTIKQQAISGHLRRRKADTLIAFVEAVDRSVADPLIILRDNSGNIKCTLHRDAWSSFSTYLMSDCCAVALRKPTILTTGSAFKKHYLNITISNILAIYSSVVLNEEEQKPLPDGFTVELQGFTMIKYDSTLNIANNCDDLNNVTNDCSNILDGLDCSVFSEEAFG